VTATARALEPRPHGVLHPWTRAAVVGLSGTGKTTFAKRILAPASRVVYFDPCHDYRDVAVPIRVDELARDASILRASELCISVEPAGADDRELALEVELVIARCREARDLVLCLDEVGDYGAAAIKPLSRLARNGRHDGIASVYVTQSAVEIPKVCRRQLTHVFSFLQIDPDDLEALRKRCGDPFVAAVKSWTRGAPPARWVLPSLLE
jgi:hypothetical protein